MQEAGIPPPVSEMLRSTPFPPAGMESPVPRQAEALMQSTPVEPMASSEFVTMMPTSWLSMSGSPSMGGRPCSKIESQTMAEPGSRPMSTSPTSGPSSTGRLTGSPPEENVSSLRAVQRAASQASCALWKASSRLVPGSSISATSMLPRIAARELLRSCAIPPASMPSDSSRWTLEASSSMCLRCVSSRITASTTSWPKATMLTS